MKVKTNNEKENPLFKRKELSLEIEHEESKTPAKAELQQYMAKHLKKDVQQIEIKSIFSDCGTAKSKAKVFVWEEKKVPDLSKAVKKEEKPAEKEKKKEEEKVSDEGKRDYAVEEKKEEAPKEAAEGEEAPAEEGKDAPKEEGKDKPAEEKKEEKADKKKK